MPKPANAKSPNNIKRLLLCDLGSRRSNKSKRTQATIKPLKPKDTKPLYSAKVPRQAGKVSENEPGRPVAVPIAASSASTEVRPRVVRRPTPIPSRTASVTTKPPSVGHPAKLNVNPVVDRPMPGRWDTDFSDTIRDPYHSSCTPTTSKGKSSYASSSTVRPARQSGTGYSSFYSPTSVFSSYDYGTSSYGGSSHHGHSSSSGGRGGDSGGWGGDSGGCSSGGGDGGGGGGGDGGGGGGC